MLFTLRCEREKRLLFQWRGLGPRGSPSQTLLVWEKGYRAPNNRFLRAKAQEWIERGIGPRIVDDLPFAKYEALNPNRYGSVGDPGTQNPENTFEISATRGSRKIMFALQPVTKKFTYILTTHAHAHPPLSRSGLEPHTAC